MSDVALRFGATDDGTLAAQFRKITGQLDGLEKNTGKTASLISGAFKGIAAAAAAVGITRLVGEALEYAEAISVASSKTGIAVDQLQRLQFIAEQSDASFESVTSAVNRLQKGLVEGSSETSAALKKLGVSITDLNAISPDQQFLRIASSIASIQSPAERSAVAMQLFGKGGAELLPLLNQGADGVLELSASFDHLGITLSSKTLDKVNEAGDAIDRLKASTKALGVELLALAAPALEGAADGITLFLKSMRFLLKGGQGDDTITNLSDEIAKLRGRAEGFARDFSASGRQRFRELSAEADALTAKLNILLGFGIEGISPLQRVGVDVESVQVSGAAQKGIQGVLADLRQPTPEELRDKHQVDTTDNIQVAIDENSLITDLNQQKLDELLRQETEHSDAMKTIDGDLARFRESIRETFGTQEISFEEAKNASILDIASGLFGALAKENSKLARIQQAIALAEAIWSTAAGITKALELPFPASIKAAAKVAVIGGIQIAKIKSTNYSAGGTSSGGGSFSGGSGSSASPAVNQTPESSERPEPQKVTQVFFNGYINNEMRKEFIEMLRDEDRRGTVIWTSRGNQAAEIRRSG